MVMVLKQYHNPFIVVHFIKIAEFYAQFLKKDEYVFILRFTESLLYLLLKGTAARTAAC